MISCFYALYGEQYNIFPTFLADDYYLYFYDTTSFYSITYGVKFFFFIKNFKLIMALNLIIYLCTLIIKFFYFNWIEFAQKVAMSIIIVNNRKIYAYKIYKKKCTNYSIICRVVFMQIHNYYSLFYYIIVPFAYNIYSGIMMID